MKDIQDLFSRNVDERNEKQTLNNGEIYLACVLEDSFVKISISCKHSIDLVLSLSKYQKKFIVDIDDPSNQKTPTLLENSYYPLESYSDEDSVVLVKRQKQIKGTVWRAQKYGQLIFNKDNEWGKTVLLTNVTRTISHLYYKNIYILKYRKTHRCKFKLKTINLEGNVEKNLSDLELGREIFICLQKHDSSKNKIISWSLLK